jgi:NCAIR mutase (PurE)-related protein
MNPNIENSKDKSEPQILQAITEFQAGLLTPTELSERILQSVSVSDGGVTADVDRARRTGFPEVVYAEGKTIDSLVAAVGRILSSLGKEQHQEVLATRVNVEQARAIGEQFVHVRWNSRARTIRVHASREPLSWDAALKDGYQSSQQTASAPAGEAEFGKLGAVAVVTAGTTDGNVAEEALETLAWMGVPAFWIQDVGVAGPYRILSRLTQLRSAKAIVVIAGMEGALPSVVAGHVGVPVFAVPTSVGYGASFGGLSALLTMLNSCASNVAAVNIDGGFRGGFLAGLVARSGQ